MFEEMHVYRNYSGVNNYCHSDYCGGRVDKVIVYILFVHYIYKLFSTISKSMPQNDYMDLHKKRFGERLDAE